MSAQTVTGATGTARARRCPLCETPPGGPCQPRPTADHLARYLDAYTAGQLTKAYLAMVLGELVVIDVCAVITCSAGADSEPEPQPGDDWCPSVSSWGTECMVSNAAHAADPRITHSDRNGDQWYDSLLDQLLAAGHTVTYEPDPVWEGSWFADLRDGDGRLVETGNGATQAEALADLARRLAAGAS